MMEVGYTGKSVVKANVTACQFTKQTFTSYLNIYNYIYIYI